MDFEMGLTPKEVADRQAKAIEECKLLNENGGTVVIHGKKYTGVEARKQIFFKHFAGYGRLVKTRTERDDKSVSMDYAVEVLYKGIGWTVLGEDGTEEIRTASDINKKSAYPNCATSAQGRALGAIGLTGGEHAATVEEMLSALTKQNYSDTEKTKDFIEAVKLAYDCCVTEDDLLAIHKIEYKKISSLDISKDTRQEVSNKCVEMYRARKNAISGQEPISQNSAHTNGTSNAKIN